MAITYEYVVRYFLVISRSIFFDGWSTHISYLPDQKIGVAVLINESTAGGRITHLLALYAYDKLLGTADAEQKYAKELDSIVAQYGKIKQSLVEAFRSRASRASQLTMPLTNYTGRYRNELLGNIDIAVDPGRADGLHPRDFNPIY